MEILWSTSYCRAFISFPNKSFQQINMWVKKANALRPGVRKAGEIDIKMQCIKYLCAHLWNINAASCKYKYSGAGHPETFLNTCLLTKHNFRHWKWSNCLGVPSGLIQPWSVSWSTLLFRASGTYLVPLGQLLHSFSHLEAPVICQQRGHRT